jgi:cupin fold WbuC family metalloprotein
LFGKIGKKNKTMEKIYSKIEPDRLLHIVRRLSDIEEQDKRVDIVPEENFIQCSTLKLENGTTFRPHKHIFKERTYEKQIAQESWIVIRGSVKCIFYDIDDTIIAEPILNVGDASFTLGGGHNYLILEDDTIVYEYKTGPYEGQEFDKTFINND